MKLAPLAAALLLTTTASAQVEYSLSFEPGGKEWRVEARFESRGEATLDFWFPLWTPGAYHVAQYGRFVKQLDAFDDQGAALAVERKEASHFVIGGAAKAKSITLSYRAEPISSAMFSNDIIDVESNRIARDYAYVNPVSLFGFLPARAHEPVRLALHLPEGWQAATVLEPDAEGRYQAESYYRFEDSPLFFAPRLDSARFEVEGKPHTVTVFGRDEEDTQEIADGCKRIVEAGAKLLGGLPYRRYHFLYGFVPEAGGSGLEHTESTLILVSPRTSIEESSHSFWGITAHEFFHLWCAERIHVEGIHAPDLTKSFSTGTIWVNEGITEYFCRHLLLHAGFHTEESLLASYFEQPIPPEAVPKQRWTEVSRAAAGWEGMDDLMTFALRMYMVGPRTILALDLELRRATNGEKGVHDLLHHLLREYVAKDRGFGEEELDEILETVGGKLAREFYERYIDGVEIPDPAKWLDVIGYEFAGRKVRSVASPSEAQLRARRDFFSASGSP
jgi:predicted metalloprotease with PDZ domain